MATPNNSTFNGPITRTVPGSVTGSGGIVKSRWASLSKDIIFEANHSPVNMVHKTNVANWVEQPLLTGKPRLQKVGVNLQVIKITCKFHFSIRPFAKVKAALANAAADGTILQWIFGTGEALGDFVIIDWDEKIIKTDEEGLIYAAEIELTLKEYAGPGVAQQTGIDAKKAAFANKPQTAVSPIPLRTLTSSQNFSANIQKIKQQNVKIQKTMTKLQKAQKSLAKAKAEIVKACGVMKKAINNVNSAINIARNIKNANAITSAASLVAVATNSLELAAGSGNPTVGQLSGLANTVSSTTGSLGQAAQGAQVVKGWFATLGK